MAILSGGVILKENRNTTKKLNKNIIMYELRNISGNPFVFIFGVIVPIFMSIVVSKAAVAEVEKEALRSAVTAISLSMCVLIPMAAVLIGHACTYSQEVEKGIPLRMSLFGFENRTIFIAKMIAELIFVTGSIVIYAVCEILILDIQKPKFLSALCFIICIYLISIIFFTLATSIVNFFKKFGPSFSIVMTLYFLIMMSCGMMGIKQEDLPVVLRVISKMLPMSYMANDFIDFWQGQNGESYNFVPLIQSFLFLGALSGILLILSTRKKD